MEEIVAGMELVFGADIELEYSYGYPAVVNSFDETNLVFSAASKIVGEDLVVEGGMTTGAEDFSYFLLDPNVEGSFFFLGGRWEEYSDGDFVPGHHSSSFLISDERTLAVGASVFLELVEGLLF
jgi:metal-dependent amidase/aminoacylase/carboxypeptidase family protein